VDCIQSDDRKTDELRIGEDLKRSGRELIEELSRHLS
jgi:hypothetical protein